MASRRKLKKQIKEATNLLIEDAFIESINGDEKEAAKMDGIIDSLVDDRYDLLNRVCNYPLGKSRQEVVAHFQAIKADLASKSADYTKKIGRVG